MTDGTDTEKPSPAPPLTSDPAAVRQLQVACECMLEFAGNRSLVPDEVIVGASRLLRVDPAAATEADEVGLRRINGLLATAIRPATVESIRIVRALEKDRRERPGTLRRWWRDCEARKQIRFPTMLLLVVLISLIVLQIYTLVLTTCVKRITELADERAAIAAEIERIETENSGNADWLLPNTVAVRKEGASDRYEGAYLLLKRWSAPWSWLVVDGAAAQSGGGPGSVAAQHSVREAAEAVLRALSLYVLPLLYGLLGANAYILRAISRQIDEHTFTLLSFYKFRLRLALGALLGASVSLIFSSDEAAAKGTGLTMAAVAFLFGYSVEFAFSIVDALIARGRMAVGAQQPAAPPPPSPSPATTTAAS